MQTMIINDGCRCNLKKESVSLRTKIVQFNDDYGFVPTHDIIR